MNLALFSKLTPNAIQLLSAAEFMDIYFDEEETLNISLALPNQNEKLLDQQEVVKLAEILTELFDVSVNLEFMVMYELH